MATTLHNDGSALLPRLPRETMNGRTSVGPDDDAITAAPGELVLDLHQPRRTWTRHVGELRLMAAVLEEAVNVIRRSPRSQAGRDAHEWMASRDASWPFAFERICDALGSIRTGSGRAWWREVASASWTICPLLPSKGP